jgi:hypothetical protein
MKSPHTKTMEATPLRLSINSSFSCNGVSEEKDQLAFANYQRILGLLAEASAQPGVEVAFDIKMRVNSSASEHPPLPPSPPPEREEMVASEEEEDSACNICGDLPEDLPEWVEMDKKRGICSTCAEHMDEGLKYYTEDFAHASEHGKDALHLFVLRQRADNCRECVADAAGSYDGVLEAHEASVQEKLLNKRAAECLARLPASFAPWWKDTWSHEKWCQVYNARKAVCWALASADVPIVQRLAAAAVAKEDKMHEMKKAHAEVLENIERARKEDLEAVEARHKRELEEAWEAGAMKGVQDMEGVLKHKLQELEAEHNKQMAEKDKRYKEALAPLLVVRDKMIAECDKKCEEADRRAHAMGYAFADQKWNPVYKAVCEELEIVRKERANHQAAYIRLLKERDEALLAQADLRQELDESAQGNEKLDAEAQALHEELAAAQKLSGWYERCVAAQNAADKLQGEVDSATQAMCSDLERLNSEFKALECRVADLQQKKELLLELVGPTQRLMTSNPELFGGEARGGAPAPGEALPSGAASPRPPPIISLPPIKEEDKRKALNFLKDLVAPSRPCLLAESPPSVLPGIVEAEASFSQTEGLCMALTEEQYQEMVKAEAEAVAAAAEPVAGAVPEPVAGAVPEPVAGAVPEPVAGAVPEPVAEAKPKPNYNHPNWPSPITKRFAKHLAKHSGKTDPKTIKTHQDALEFIAKRANVSVETLLKWTINHYWTLVQGSSHHFHMSTGSATWWC